jgi:hypothetical protein
MGDRPAGTATHRPVFAAGLAGAIGLPRAFSLALLAVGIVVWTIIFTTLGTFGLAALH